MRSENAVKIRQLDLFKELQDSTFQDLIEASFLQKFPKSVCLIRENERADFLHVVVEGLVEMYAATDTRETTLEIIAPVGVFILAAVLNDQVYLQSARTLEPSSILMIPAERVRLAMETDQAFMRAIVMELAASYRRTIKDLKSQKLRNGAERLANWLLRMQRERGHQSLVEIPVEKRVLASHLGMTPENLSRAFLTLRSYGVKVQGSRVEIEPLEALLAFAKPDPLIDDPENMVRYTSG